MSLYVPTSFGQLIKVGEMEDGEESGRRETGVHRDTEKDRETCYFRLIIWELEKQLDSRAKRINEEKKQRASRSDDGSPQFRWLTEFDTPKTSITPILYQLVEKKCNELSPEYAEAALRKFQATDFNDMPLEDIPWTLLSILREQKLEQDNCGGRLISENPPTSVFSRIENWLSWSSQLSRRRARIALNEGADGPLTLTSQPGSETDVWIPMTSSRFDSDLDQVPIPEVSETHQTDYQSQGHIDKPTGRRSLLSLKGRELSFKKLSSSRRYATLSDEPAQALFVVTSTSSGDFKEVSLNTNDFSSSGDDSAVERMQTKLKQLKEVAVSFLDNFRRRGGYDSTNPTDV